MQEQLPRDVFYTSPGMDSVERSRTPEPRAYRDVLVACLRGQVHVSRRSIGTGLLESSLDSLRIRRKLGSPPKTRCYVQDVRYFANEHMDVRREVFQICTAHQLPMSLGNCSCVALPPASLQSCFWRSQSAGTHIPA
jgi:hypothetical protein